MATRGSAAFPPPPAPAHQPAPVLATGDHGVVAVGDGHDAGLDDEFVADEHGRVQGVAVDV